MGNCIKCNARRPHSGSTYSSRSWRSRFQSISNGGTEQKIMSAQYSYEGSDEGELSFEKGDQMVIIDDKEPDWWLAKRYNSETTGYIPMSYVVMNMIETEDWFFSKTSRRLAEKLLLLDAYPRGTFLVRDCEQNTGAFSLSIRDFDSLKLNHVKHYRIRQNSDSEYYLTVRYLFAKLQDLVAHYSNKSHGLCCRLHKPCPKSCPTKPPKCLQEINRQDLSLRRELGRGNFGKVYYGLFKNEVEVAIKAIKPGIMSSEASIGLAAMMRKYRHKHLVSLYGVCSMDEPLLIVTEYMCNGSLLDYLRNSPDGEALTVNDLIDMSAQISSGMAYLEAIKVVHRDLAARNILVGQNKEVKVADFGLARSIDGDEYVSKIGLIYPIKWTAPEALNTGRFTSKSDVWSFGILLYELMTKGGTPYPGMNQRDLREQLDRGYRMPFPIHSECPNNIYQIMVDCWHKDPGQRPTFEYLHYFFDDYYVATEPLYIPLYIVADVRIVSE